MNSKRFSTPVSLLTGKLEGTRAGISMGNLLRRLFAKYPGTSWRLALLSLTLPLVVVSAVFIWQDYQSRRDAITTQVKLQSAQINAQLEDFVHTVGAVSGQFATDWTSRYPSSKLDPALQQSQIASLAQFESFRPHFSHALIADGKGVIRLSTDQHFIGQRLGPTDLYELAGTNRSFAVSDVVISSEGTAPSVLFVQPLLLEGEANGFLILRSSLDTISSALDMSNPAFPRTGKAGIFDSQGRVLAGTGYVAPHPGLVAGRDISGSAVWAQAVRHPSEEWFGPGLDKIDRIIFFEYPDMTPWVTTVAYAQSELFNPLWQRLEIFGAALAVTVVAILLVGEFVIRKERRVVTLLEDELHQRQKTEEALRVSENRFRQLFDDAPIGYQELDNAGRFTRVNKTGLAMLGYTSEELMGTPVWTYIGNQENARQIIGSQLEGATPPEGAYELEFLRKDGTKFPALVEDRLIRDAAGQIVGLRSTVLDITERKQAEVQIQESGRLASLGELAAGVAHEINNPLTAVVGFSELLMRQNLPDPAANYAQRINVGGQRAALMVNKLLDFARKREPVKQNAAITDVINQALALTQFGPNIEIESQLSDDLPTVWVDQHQIIQVLINVLTNAEQALQATPDTGRILLSATSSNGNVKISVKDNGPGISPDELPKIFEPFFTTKQVGKGTGLGLSLCNAIIRQHNGEIWAESEQGEGATIYINLPVISDYPGQIPEKAPTDSIGSSGQRILVVDDEESIRDLLQFALSEDGHLVDVAAGSEQGFEYTSKYQYDCIIMDLKMPKGGGQGLYERIANLDPDLARRVIFCTGDTIGDATRIFLNQTPNSVINKPFNLYELRQKIDEVTLEQVLL